MPEPYTFNLYPEQLRRIAALCEGLNEVDGIVENDDTKLGLQQHIQVMDETGQVYGSLSDEIGGAWAFTPLITVPRDV